MSHPVRLASLVFNEGTVVEVSNADVVVLVGPNNSGKSQTLNEIRDHLGRQPGAPRTAPISIADVSVDLLVDSDGLADWLVAHRVSHPNPQQGPGNVRAVGFGDIGLPDAINQWRESGEFAALAPQLVRFVGPGDARTFLGSPGRLHHTSLPEHAVHTLTQPGGRLESFRTATRSAFQRNVIVDAWGSSVQLRLARTEVQSDFEASSATGYPPEGLSQRLERLPLLESQSDGFRAFTGLLLSLLAIDHPIVLIDEPETFLHPPQARLLGEYLTTLRGEGQMVIATHSLDLLLGLLAGASARILVVRLQRVEDRTRPLVIEPDQVRSLWDDSTLRFSRALDGLFHEGVVICEGDSDAHFYSTVAQRPEPSVATSTDPFSRQSPDVMFTFAGGKQRIPRVAMALNAVEVPVRVIVDFDVLNSETTLRSLVESLGSEFNDAMERDRQTVDSNVRGATPILTAAQLNECLSDAFAGHKGLNASPTLIATLSRLLDDSKPWALAKRSGRAAVTGGDANQALTNLLEALAERGIFVVESGAMESLVPEGHGSSAAFVADVIERDLLTSATRPGEFLSRVMRSFVG